MEGYIKCFRSLLEWEWWDDDNTLRVWIWLLLNANYKSAVWHGIPLKAGQLITSYATVAEKTGRTINEVRTVFSHLKNSKNITCKTTNKFQLVTIAKWELYQSEENETTGKSTGKSQAINRLLTTDKESKEYKNKKNNITPLCSPFGEFQNVMLTESELEKLKARFPDYQNRIEKLSAYMATKKTNYRSHYAVIIQWALKDERKGETDGKAYNAARDSGNAEKPKLAGVMRL